MIFIKNLQSKYSFIYSFPGQVRAKSTFPFTDVRHTLLPRPHFHTLGFQEYPSPCAWWALDQRKTTISAHLWGNSTILNVFHYFSHILSPIQQSLPYGCISPLKTSLCHILLFSDWNSSVFIPQALALIYFITTSSYPFPFPNLILFFFTLRAPTNITSGETNENTSFCSRLQASSTKIKT